MLNEVFGLIEVIGFFGVVVVVDICLKVVNVELI